MCATLMLLSRQLVPRSCGCRKVLKETVKWIEPEMSISYRMVKNACDSCGHPWSFADDENNGFCVIKCAGWGPDLDEDTTHHRGVYPRYLLKFVSDGYHKPIIERLVDYLRNAVMRPTMRHIRIVFLDYYGIHSNVAACKVVAECVNAANHFEMAEVILHAPENGIAAGGWFQDSFYPEDDHPEVKVALDTALTYFYETNNQ